MKTVRATALGYYNGSRVRPGAVFQVDDGAKASWWEIVPPPEPPPPAPRRTLKLADQAGSDLV